MDRSSYTKNSKENSTGAANSRNNKYKESNNNRKDQNRNNNSRGNTNSPLKCTYCRKDGQFIVKRFKHPQGESCKGKPEN